MSATISKPEAAAKRGGCGAIDCVNRCDGDYDWETCPNAIAASSAMADRAVVMARAYHEHLGGNWHDGTDTDRRKRIAAMVIASRSAPANSPPSARLTDAAPDLLAAAKHVLAGALSLPRFAEDELRAAIAKAEDHQPSPNPAPAGRDK